MGPRGSPSIAWLLFFIERCGAQGPRRRSIKNKISQAIYLLTVVVVVVVVVVVNSSSSSSSSLSAITDANYIITTGSS